MLNHNTSVPTKQKISLNIPFLYVFACVLIAFGEREAIQSIASDLANSSKYSSDPNPQIPVFQEYTVDSQSEALPEWRNPYLYFKTAYISEQDIIDMPTKYQASLEKDTVEKATDSG